MCSKKDRFSRLGGIVLAAALFASASPLFAQERIVDGVAAVVNDKVITLFDIEVVEAFGIVEGPIDADLSAARRSILERLIDRKIVLDLSRSQTPVDPARIEVELSRITGRLGEGEMRARLLRLGLAPADLRPYIEEALRVDSVIAERFSRTVTVNLDEIEARYRDRYVPAEQAALRTPKPFLEVVDLLENEIRAEKIGGQSVLWVQSLREQAEIEIRPDILKK